MTLNEALYSILPIFVSVISAIGSFLITYFNTRQKSIQKKVDRTLDISTHNTKKISLAGYYILNRGQKVYLNDLHIYKEDSNG